MEPKQRSGDPAATDLPTSALEEENTDETRLEDDEGYIANED